MIKKSLVANYLGQSSASILTVIFLPIYAKYIGNEGLGLIGIYTTIQICLNIFDLGMTPTIIREIARIGKNKISIRNFLNLLKTVEIISLLVSFLIILFFYFSANYFSSEWIHGDELTKVDIKNLFFLIGILSASRIIEGIYRGALMGLQKYIEYNLIISITALLRTAGVVSVFIFFSSTVYTFFYWQIAISLISVIVFRLILQKHLPKSSIRANFSLKSLNASKKYSMGMLSISILSLALTQIDKILLSKLLHLSEYGIYTLAVVAASSIYMLIFPITQTWFPIFAKLNSQKKNIMFSNNFHKASQLVTVLSGSAAVTLVIFTKNFSNVWIYNQNISDLTIFLIQILVVGNFLNGLTYIPYNAQLAYGWTSLGLKNNILSILLIVPLLILIVPKYGALGAALIWVGLNIFYIFGAVNIMFNYILKGERYAWFINDTFKPIFAATLAALFLQKFINFTLIELNDWTMLILASCISLLASIFASNLIRVDFIKFLSIYLKKLSK